MAKKKVSARLARLLAQPISDRELGAIYIAAVASKDRRMMRKATEQMAERSDWSVFDSRFEIPSETHTRAGDIEGGTNVERIDEDPATERAWKSFERKLARVRDLYDAVAAGEAPDWGAIERATDAAAAAAPNRKAQLELVAYDFTIAEQQGASFRAEPAPRERIARTSHHDAELAEQTRRELARVLGRK